MFHGFSAALSPLKVRVQQLLCRNPQARICFAEPKKSSPKLIIYPMRHSLTDSPCTHLTVRRERRATVPPTPYPRSSRALPGRRHRPREQRQEELLERVGVKVELQPLLPGYHQPAGQAGCAARRGPAGEGRCNAAHNTVPVLLEPGDVGRWPRVGNRLFRLTSCRSAVGDSHRAM